MKENIKKNLLTIGVILLGVMVLFGAYKGIHFILTFGLENTYGIHKINGQEFEITYTKGVSQRSDGNCIYTPKFSTDNVWVKFYEVGGDGCGGGYGCSASVIRGVSVNLDWNKYTQVELIYKYSGSLNVGPQFVPCGAGVSAGIKDKVTVGFNQESWPAHDTVITLNGEKGIRLIKGQNNQWDVYELGITQLPIGSIEIKDDDVLFFQATATPNAAGSPTSGAYMTMDTTFIGKCTGYAKVSGKCTATEKCEDVKYDTLEKCQGKIPPIDWKKYIPYFIAGLIVIIIVVIIIIKKVKKK